MSEMTHDTRDPRPITSYYYCVLYLLNKQPTRIDTHSWMLPNLSH